MCNEEGQARERCHLSREPVELASERYQWQYESLSNTWIRILFQVLKLSGLHSASLSNLGSGIEKVTLNRILIECFPLMD